MKIKQTAVERKWYFCPFCGKKLLIYDNTAKMDGGIFVKCKWCKNEIEIKK